MYIFFLRLPVFWVMVKWFGSSFIILINYLDTKNKSSSVKISKNKK